MSNGSLVLFNLLKRKVYLLLKFIYDSYSGKKEDSSKLYRLEEVYRNSEGKQTVIAKIIGTPRGVFKQSASKLVTERRELLSGFGIDDIVNIVGLAASEKEPLVVEMRHTPYKYYTLLAMIFGAVLIISNILSSKLIMFFGHTMTGGQLIFPLSYALGDVITEVYGYKRARQLIWGAIICNVILVIFAKIAIVATPSPYWHNQSEFAEIIGAVPRVVIASLIGYFCGEFINSYVLAKMKIFYRGKSLWRRVIGSSTVAIAVASVVFTSIAFVGSMPAYAVVGLIIRVYLACFIYEILALPITYKLINVLKKREQIDIYDNSTNFSPFSLDVDYSESSNYYKKEPLHAS